MNKRGVFLEIYLVLLTLFMCGFVVSMYSMQTNHVQNSVVSPVKLLELQDVQEKFELQEKELIFKSVCDSGLDNWGSNKDDIKKNFCKLFIESEQEEFREFIFLDLNFKNRKDWEGAFDDSDEQKNFCEDVWELDFVGGELEVKRKDVGKFFTLFAKNRKKINFAVDVDYSLDKNSTFTKQEVKC